MLSKGGKSFDFPPFFNKYIIMSNHPYQYCVIGKSLGHSLSPSLHNESFTAIASYAKFHIKELDINELSEFIKLLRKGVYKGASITIPYKQAVLDLVDELTPQAKNTNAINTLYLKENILWGDNTDIQGFLYPLKKRNIPNRALILGAGGASRAIIIALKQLRHLGMTKIFLSARDINKTKNICSEFNIIPIDWEKRTSIKTSWIINTTPLGMRGVLCKQSPYPYNALLRNFQKNCLVYDIVYNPIETQFLQDAKRAGWHIQNGLDMFIAQALAQQEIWFNKSADFKTIKNFIKQKLFAL